MLKSWSMQLKKIIFKRLRESNLIYKCLSSTGSGLQKIVSSCLDFGLLLSPIQCVVYTGHNLLEIELLIL